jgi:CheY-like chemotaxis protein
MLGHRMRVVSTPGRGSCFSVEVPVATADQVPAATPDSTPAREQTPLAGLCVLCVDNDIDILDGMRLLLERWGCRVMTAPSKAAAQNAVRNGTVPDLLLVDYHLEERANGLDVVDSLDREFERRFPAIIITADRSARLEEEVRRRNYGLLRKPIKPAALRALMSNLVKAIA